MLSRPACLIPAPETYKPLPVGFPPSEAMAHFFFLTTVAIEISRYRDMTKILESSEINWGGGGLSGSNEVKFPGNNFGRVDIDYIG